MVKMMMNDMGTNFLSSPLFVSAPSSLQHVTPTLPPPHLATGLPKSRMRILGITNVYEV